MKYFNDVQIWGVRAFLEIIPEFDRKMAFRVYFMMLSSSTVAQRADAADGSSPETQTSGY